MKALEVLRERLAARLALAEQRVAENDADGFQRLARDCRCEAASLRDTLAQLDDVAATYRD